MSRLYSIFNAMKMNVIPLISKELQQMTQDRPFTISNTRLQRILELENCCAKNN